MTHNCPYCNSEIEPTALGGEAIESGHLDCYFENDHCVCPNCGKKFKRIAYYVTPEYEIRPMEDDYFA